MDSRITRRTLSAGALATAVRLSLPGRPTSGQEEERVLRILGWPSYFPGELTAAFREANNVRIEVTGIATPDDTMLFLRAGGVGLYDLVAPTIGIVAPLGASGLLAPLDLASIPNSVDLLSPFGERPEVMVDDQQFGMPLLWGTFGLVAAVEVESAPESWLDLRDERYTDQLVMPDDGLTHITLWNWALGAEDPLRVSKDALDETTGVLIELKQTRAASFGGSAYDAMMRVADGAAQFATVGWQSAPLLTTANQRALVASQPSPGGSSFCDCIAMVADCHDPELAQQFIDFMISPEAQRDLVDRTRWATVAESATPMIQPDIASLYPYDALDAWFDHSPIRGYPPVSDDGNGTATYLDWILAWDRVRQAKL
ncbi:MAG: PotD/PotF family extracellular solute-binding protein [Thermomicrobiales bacterium]|nr:PotD/PotF family extracellular solute-binding protein [Thermomicrobiales bacterium]